MYSSKKVCLKNARISFGGSADIVTSVLFRVRLLKTIFGMVKLCMRNKKRFLKTNYECNFFFIFITIRIECIEWAFFIIPI